MNATANREVIGEVLEMARTGRPGLTALQKTELWNRWKQGESYAEIGRALHRTESAIWYIVSARGGVAPQPRRRRIGALTLAQREEISRSLAAGLSMRTIAAGLGKAASTVSREVARNGGTAHYRAAPADGKAWERAKRPKKCRLALNARLRALVTAKLIADWSPQQIEGWLKAQFPDNPAMHVSHETIYRTLFVQARGALKKALASHLRSRRAYRNSKRSRAKNGPHPNLLDPISIRERPAEVDDRAVPGHWEGDLLIGNPRSQIATLVERQSRFTILVKLEGRDMDTVDAALTKRIKKLPATLRRSLTWDRGSEMGRHREFTIATDVKVYFCDPRSPWQRGTNENTNGLLRQYFPKGTDLSRFTQAQLNRIALKLNQRPRKTLSYRTPADKLSELLR